MIGVFIITHSPLAKALIESSKMIAGDNLENCDWLTLNLGEDLDEFANKFQEKLDLLDLGEGVLVLVDLFSGTPANIAMRALRNRNFECVSGVNLGMLLEVLTSRSYMTLDELKEVAIQAGKDTVVDISGKLKGVRK